MKITKRARMDEAIRSMRYRVGRLYGVEPDVELVDDDELAEMIELSSRVLRTFPREASGSEAVARHQAHAYADRVEREIAAQPAHVQSGASGSNAKKLADLARTEGRVPSRGEVAATLAGKPLPATLRLTSGGFQDVIEWDAITKEEAVRLEQLVAKAIGKGPDHFEWLRLRPQFEALDKMVNGREKPKRPRWEEPGSVTLPASVFEGIAANTIDRDEYVIFQTVPGIAVLAVLLHLFADPDSDVLHREVARWSDDRKTLILHDGSRPWRVTADPNSQIGRWKEIVSDLVYTEWLVADMRPPENRISLGPRALELFEGRGIEPKPRKRTRVKAVA